MTFRASQRAIAQILYAEGSKIAGTGFLVAEGYLLTCAHVVEKALSGTNDPLKVELWVIFFGTTEPQRAEVILYEYEKDRLGRDAAVLRLVEGGPKSIAPAPLRPLRQDQDDNLQVKVFGYPGENNSGGGILNAVTRGEVSGGWVQIEDTKVTGLAVEEGFSGAPVWCETEAGILGMVVARRNGPPQEKVGYMIPVQQLYAYGIITQEKICRWRFDALSEQQKDFLKCLCTIGLPVNLKRKCESSLVWTERDAINKIVGFTLSQDDIEELKIKDFIEEDFSQENKLKIKWRIRKIATNLIAPNERSNYHQRAISYHERRRKSLADCIEIADFLDHLKVFYHYCKTRRFDEVLQSLWRPDESGHSCEDFLLETRGGSDYLIHFYRYLIYSSRFRDSHPSQVSPRRMRDVYQRLGEAYSKKGKINLSIRYLKLSLVNPCESQEN